VVIVNREFPPDIAAAGSYSADLAAELARNSIRVTVIAGPPSAVRDGIKHDAHTSGKGISVRRVRSLSASGSNLAARAATWVSFALGAVVELQRVDRPDLVVTTTSPPILPWACALSGRAPIVVWSMDLYPEVLHAAGMFRAGSIIDRCWSAMDRLAMSRSACVVAMGEMMRERITRRPGSAPRVVSIHPWPLASPRSPAMATDRPGLEVLYAGNMGHGHDWQAIARAQALLASDPGVRWTIMGGGFGWQKVREAAGRGAIANARFLPFLPTEEATTVMSDADVHLVSIDPAFDGLMFPSKLCASFREARPVILVGDERSEIAAIIRDTGVGFVVPPGDGSGLAAAVRRLRDDRGLRSSMGLAALALAEGEFSRDRLLGDWLRTISEAIPDRC
jgi:glycosyltransferase involved in cell wall biosynthesis